MNKTTTPLFLKKGSTYLIAALFVCFSGMFLTAQDAKAQCAGDPIEISSYSDLDGALRDNAEDNCNFIQTADIDAFATLESIPFFSGNYDGQGHSISNMGIDGAGLFSIMSTANFKNVALINVNNLQPDLNNSGILAGSAANGTIIENVYLQGAFRRASLNGENHGGFVGVLAGEVDEFGDPIPGGTQSVIRDSHADIITSGNRNVGGVAGLVDNGRIERVYSIGVVKASTEEASRRGPVVGFVASGNFANVYYNSETVGITDFAGRTGIEGLNSKQMKSSNQFNNWDFGNVWTIYENVSFPTLELNNEPLVVGPNIEVESDNSGGGEDFDSGLSAWRHFGSVLESTYSAMLSSLRESSDYLDSFNPGFGTVERNADSNQHFRLWTQGFSGAETSNGQANVQIWNVNENDDPLSSNFVGISNLNNSIGFGEAFTMFVFSEQLNGTATNVTATGFPKYPLFRGTPFNQNADIEATTNPTIDDWNFFANSYLVPVNAGGIVTSDVSNVVYKWDPGANTHRAASIVGNGNGNTAGFFSHIAPFQGVLMQTSGSNPQITIPSGAQAPDNPNNQGNHSSAGDLLVKSFSMEVAVPESPFRSSAYVSFSEEHMDEAFRLMPQGGYAFVELALEGTGSSMMQSRHFQGDLNDVVEIPLTMNYFEAVDNDWENKSQTVSLSWSNLDEFNAEWEFTLLDTETGIATNLREVSSIEIQLEGDSDKKIEDMDAYSPTDIVVRSADKNLESRFVLQIEPGTLTSTPGNNNLPEQISLNQNYPNPFNPTTNIEYSLNEASDVTLEVYNMTSQRVAVLENGTQSAGTHTVSFDASSLSSGVYMYRLQAGNTVLTRKMTLIK